MNADILRLILFIGGLALILGIYLWDRRKRANSRINAVRRSEPKAQFNEPDAVQSPPRQEPVWKAADVPSPEIDESPRPRGQEHESEVLRQLGEMVQEQPNVDPDPLFEPLEQTVFSFDQEAQDKAELPVKLLQINLRSRHGVMSGEAIVQAAKEVNLQPGEMQIFHHQLPGGRGQTPLFSMASMVEPGTFPFDDLADFTTPGLTLFAQLPGVRDGLEVFDRLLDTAHRLSVRLDAEILDETRSGMSKQTIEHTREEIREHSRLVRLARSRR